MAPLRKFSGTLPHDTLQDQLDFFRATMNTPPATETRTQSERPKRKFVLCFDGTGNKFSGTDADSNILKIYRMLDRNEDDQFHYYQPGIGTYVVAKNTKASGRMTSLARLKSWYTKAKDSAIGTSFDEHVMGGYRFLMRYYSPGDDIYLFGFSRGAYTARFLSEMLDHVGLLSAGNEEMCHFAWKTFQRWQCRQERNPVEKQEKRELLEFMCAFRETFSRPVKPIRFLGLFDTVNSVPSFENAWMQRSKFPYTARSSARVIRHAVSIDERRAKFRQDLISGEIPNSGHNYKRRHRTRAVGADGDAVHGEHFRGFKPSIPDSGQFTLRLPERYRRTSSEARQFNFRSSSESRHFRDLSPIRSERDGRNSATSTVSNLSLDAVRKYQAQYDSDDEGPQDIREVWFAGCHADIGGGWSLHPDEQVALSHVPLVWMVREAQKAGLQFDDVKLTAHNCNHSDPHPPSTHPSSPDYTGTQNLMPVPTIEIDPATPPAVEYRFSPFDLINPVKAPEEIEVEQTNYNFLRRQHTKFHKKYLNAATRGKIHDVLNFKNGASSLSVLSWNVMEYLPFRRMDLQEDGSWRAITWPLPKGETRDIPDNAIIHGSVIKRMQADPTYRPGNLIVGGGGRGVRTAPEKMGMGKWKVIAEEGHVVGECYSRQEKPERKKVEMKRRVLFSTNGPQGLFPTRR